MTTMTHDDIILNINYILLKSISYIPTNLSCNSQLLYMIIIII